MPTPHAIPIVLSEEDRRILDQFLRSPSTAVGTALRARVLLAAATGKPNTAISRETAVSRGAVAAWRKRFSEGGLSGLIGVRPGRGRKPTISPEKIEQIVNATLQSKPAGQTHWSCRTMAKAQGVSPATVQRVWDANGLQPHRSRTFKLSRDKRFVEKLTDVVGLYMAPPDNAVVLCVDEKSQIQALDRTQPGLPMKKGRCGTMTHDYKRNGTTTLFAALNVLTGAVKAQSQGARPPSLTASLIGQCLPRHRHQEFLKFLRRIDREFPPGLALHLIVDNYGTHNHPLVKAWLARHPRFRLHFTPTSSSWLNLIERWFAEITDKAIRRGAFGSVDELIAAIEAFLAAHNDNPKPFVWTASVETIKAKIEKCKLIYETVH